MVLSCFSCTAMATGAVALGLGLSAQATDLATASYDSDSYIHFGIDSAFAPEMTVGAHLPTINHFNFGVIEFEISGLSSAGGKFLHLDLEVFRTTVTDENGPTGATEDLAAGNATLRLVALGEDYRTGYAPASDKRGWYDTNLYGQDVIAAVTLTDAGVFSIDVTDTVNAWIADTNTNHGFGLIVESGSPIELGATEGGNGAVLTNVPEPGAAAILGLGALFMLRRRR